MESKRKRRIKTIILMSIIWFVVTLPLPWLFTAPDEVTPQVNTLFYIIILISIPFVMLTVVWTLKPELTT